MGIRKDLQKLEVVLQLLEEFLSDKLDFEGLHSSTYSLLSSLEAVNEGWKSQILSEWFGLENMYATALAQEEETCTPDEIRYQKLKISKEDKQSANEIAKKMSYMIHALLTDVNLSYCPSCGYDTSDLENAISSSKDNYICECCGMLITSEKPVLETVRRNRNLWLQHPMLWHNPQAMPENWKLEDQMEHIPTQYL